MPAYYNEIDPYCAAWLRNLIIGGHIAPGEVDTRSIVEVRPDDLKGYDQCHFFAGIGGWSLALRLAGIPDDRPVWTGSCPCQPFSAAGKGKAANDERHLAPAWLSLIAECRPGIVFGEQVEAAIGWGWLDFVFDALEAQGYACGATVLPACGVGAPHIRQRVYFVADSEGGGLGEFGDAPQPRSCGHADGSLIACQLADDAEPGRQPRRGPSEASRGRDSPRLELGRLRDAHSMGDAIEPRLEGLSGHGDDRDQPGRQRADSLGSVAAADRAGFWSDIIWLPCRDGKARPTKPGIQPLAHGVSARVGKLRAAGNAISPQVAEAFIRACGVK